MSRPRTKARSATPPELPAVVETFRRPGFYERGQMEQREPSCFNGRVSFRRYRITVEEIAEPVDVLAARLQKLWDESGNHHDWHPLCAAASEIGYELQGSPGKSVVKGRTP